MCFCVVKAIQDTKKFSEEVRSSKVLDVDLNDNPEAGLDALIQVSIMLNKFYSLVEIT